MGLSWSSFSLSAWLGEWFPKKAYKITMVRPRCRHGSYKDALHGRSQSMSLQHAHSYVHTKLLRCTGATTGYAKSCVQVGLDNAGKTTALYKLSFGQTVATAPTIGSNVERVQIGNLAFEIWDLGGQASLRSSWHLYFTGVDAVIVVVDSSDRSRVSIAKQELYQILATRELETVPLLLLANKQVCCDLLTPCLTAQAHVHGFHKCADEQSRTVLWVCAP
jgi:small GTP-binding protein